MPLYKLAKSSDIVKMQNEFESAAEDILSYFYTRPLVEIASPDFWSLKMYILINFRNIMWIIKRIRLLFQMLIFHGVFTEKEFTVNKDWRLNSIWDFLLMEYAKYYDLNKNNCNLYVIHSFYKRITSKN